MHLLDLGVIMSILNALCRRKRVYRDFTLPGERLQTLDYWLTFLLVVLYFEDWFQSPTSSAWRVTKVARHRTQVSSPRYRANRCSPWFGFLLLHVAVKLLSNSDWCVTDGEYTNKVLYPFVNQCEEVYGDAFMCSNIHMLKHLAVDVSLFRPIHRFSAYQFENVYGFL